MKFAKLALVATAMALTPISAHAGEVAVGATVYGPEGNSVGTVESVADGVATVDTGKHKAPLPLAAFGPGDTGPTITVTKAQIDAMLDEQVAAASARRDAALVEGAPVVSATGVEIGSVKSIDEEADTILVEREGGLVTLKREHFAVDANGALMALFTLEQIETATVGT